MIAPMNISTEQASSRVDILRLSARSALSSTLLVALFSACNPLGVTSPSSPLVTQRDSAYSQWAMQRQAEAAERARVVRLAGKWSPLVEQSARLAGIDPVLVAAVLHTENQGFIDACADRVSKAGAIGPMQLMPYTASQQLHVDPWDPQQNIRAGAQYLSYLVRRFGDVRQALAAYNAGPTAVDLGRAGGEAWTYADKVLHFMQTPAKNASGPLLAS